MLPVLRIGGSIGTGALLGERDADAKSDHCPIRDDAIDGRSDFTSAGDNDGISEISPVEVAGGFNSVSDPVPCNNNWNNEL